MATSSLSNFTVPLSTNQSASSQGLLMPKLKFRFRVTFLNFGVTQPSTELTKQVIDFKRPQVTFDPIEIPIYNSKVYLAGKPTWAECSCNLRDDASGEVTKRVGEQMQKQFDFFEQASASSGIDYKFQTILEILDGGNGASTPNILETWELQGCYLSAADYADNNYATNGPMTIALTIRYDNALQTPTGSGIGASVTRTFGTVITG
jgi:hypothetical protein